jgi:choline dehydrogenase-like flavoprotein
VRQVSEFDAIVIGSGAGGGPLAATLAEAGMKVLILEKGPHHTRREFVHDEIGICRRDFFVPALIDDPHALLLPGETKCERSHLGWIAQCVGGGTVHMAGYFYRLHPDDFRMRSRFGGGGGLELADWPFTYEELEPYYTRVEQEIGVSGRAGSNPFEGPRSKPYPMDPLTEHPMVSWLDEAGARLGWRLFPSPRAIASREFGGRGACAYCDFCGSYGCETGAKSSTLESVIPRALATGRAELRARCMARQITTRPDGRARGCLYIDAEGREREATGSIVVVACSAVESARLLLLSGIANGNGLVGRHLQFQASSSGRAWFRFEGRTEETRRTLKARHPFLERSAQDFYFLPPGAAEPPKGGTIRFGFPHANPIYTALRLAHEGPGIRWGALLKKRLQEHYHEGRAVEFEAFHDFYPNPGTRVDLDPEMKDRWGLPSARIRLDAPALHDQVGRFLREKGCELLRATGADEVEEGAAGAVTPHLVHGTCRAGLDPRTSVLDRFCRSHEVRNLFVTDGSFMPTSGGVPTTLTIMANSFRVADHIVEEARRGSFR